MAMRKFLELRSQQGVSWSQKTKEVTMEGDTECKRVDSVEDGHSQTDARSKLSVLSELYFVDVKNNGIMPRNKIAQAAKAKLKKIRINSHIMQ